MKQYRMTIQKINRQEHIKDRTTYIERLRFTGKAILTHADKVWEGAETYQGKNIKYLGIEAHNSCIFYMIVNFQTIHSLILSMDIVLVHGAVEVSRSATLVLAYLMLKQNPRSFLRQLANFNTKLYGYLRKTSNT
uniref:Uncharacterized protein n=1 Tax=Oncorhynchus mykiss TaxID=8022 RepID=A0A8C7VYS1_ONCMY